MQLQRVALFYEKNAADAYFLGWLRNKNFSDDCYLADPLILITFTATPLAVMKHWICEHH
jgi:hypothetical protein